MSRHHRFDQPFANAREVAATIGEIGDVPWLDRAPAASAYALLQQAGQLHGDAPALVDLDLHSAGEGARTWTFRSLLSDICAAARWFENLGVERQDAVGLLSPTMGEAVIAHWAASTAGIASPVNSFLDPPQIAEILAASGAKVLLAYRSPERGEIWAKATAVKALMPDLTVVPVVEPGSADGADFLSAARRCSGEPLAADRQPRPTDVAAHLHTGGTTGAPKIARQTHANQVYAAWLLGDYIGLGPDDAYLMALPLFHANALLVGCLGPLSTGARVLLAGRDGYRDRRLLFGFKDLVETHGATLFNCVPTVLRALLDAGAVTRPLGALRFAGCGGAPMPAGLAAEFERASGIPVVEGYGLTEGGALTCLNPIVGPRRAGSVGVVMPYQHVRIVAAEAGRWRDVAPGQPGLVAIQGPNVFAGYRQSEHEAGVWIEPGWLNSGDLGRLDEDGFLHLTGREKDLIIRGGHNIDPQAVEAILERHPAVAQCAVVGRPDAYAGQVPMAYVVLREGAAATEAELVAFAREHVQERAAAPVRVCRLSALPLTAVGKVFKPTLRALAAADALDGLLGELSLPPLGVDGVRAQPTGALEVVLPEAWRRARTPADLARLRDRVEALHLSLA